MSEAETEEFAGEYLVEIRARFLYVDELSDDALVFVYSFRDLVALARETF